jgi:2-phosphosulfolactate phosphatase
VRVHVAFTPQEDVEAPIGVVVDVLRATSTIVQALASGYRRVLCCAEIDEAHELARTEGPAVLGGERRGLRIDGFDLGNSPAEYVGEPRAETLVLTTTNGTRLLVAAAVRCERVLVGSLLNLGAVAAAVRATGADEAAVLCAGVGGELALDDAYCAGRIVEEIGGERTDSAEAAVRLVRSFPDAVAGLGASRSAGNLRRAGLAEDVEWCSRESVVDALPVLARMIGPAAEIVLTRA